MEDFGRYLRNQRTLSIDVGALEPQFWRMTPAELKDRVKVLRRAEARQQERAAWIVHYVWTAFAGSKNAPSVDELLGRVRKVM